MTQIPVFGFFASILIKKIHSEYDLLYSNYTPLFCRLNKPLVAGFQATRLGEYKACQEAGKPVQALLNKLYIPLDKLLIKKADMLVSLSREMIGELNEMGGSEKYKEIIPNGVDEKLFFPKGEKMFNRPVREILFVGRLDSRKNLRLLINALNRIKRKIRTRLTVIGLGREYHALKLLTNRINLDVHFLGHIRHIDLPRIYNKADLFVLPSLYEGIPLAALEAMACGVPTILSDGSPDIGIPRFKRRSETGLSKMLEEILSSDSTLTRLSEKSYELSRSYRWENIVNIFFRMIETYR